MVINPIRLYKMLYELNKSIKKNSVVHIPWLMHTRNVHMLDCNDLCSIRKWTITGNATLWMNTATGCELPYTNDQLKEWQINDQRKQDKDKYKPKINIKDNPYTNSKIIRKQTTLLQVQMWNLTDLKVIKLHNEFSDAFTQIVCFKDTFSLKIKDDTNP